MVRTTYDEIEIDFNHDREYEEERQRETAMLNRRYVLAFEKKYNCTFPEFIMMDHTEEQRMDLVLWAASIRYLAVNNENLYIAG